MIRICLAFALGAAAAGFGAANAQDFFNQEWLLNPRLSNVYMQTVKANAIFETHRFTSIEGSVSKDGVANVKIELASLETGIDIRDVRMRFLMFETYKFPYAEISAKLDKARLQDISTKTRIIYPLKLELKMHGTVNEIETPVWITRINDATVSVASIQPVIVTAESVGLSKNLVKLMEVIGGTPIASGASITFDLVFGTGSLQPELAAAREIRVQQRAEQAAKNITAEACETRFTVVSEKSAIYFKTGSAEIDQESEPLLDSVVDIAKRCPSVKFNVNGHTDYVGGNDTNQRLSERRAKSVVNYLTAKGIDSARIQSAGYGETRPVAPNDTEENRARNRRIEFKVIKG